MFRTTNPIQAPVKRFTVRWGDLAAFTAVAAVSVLVTLAVVNVALGPGTSPAEPATPACATEDSTGCFWNAQTQGNGTGDSFYVDEAGQVYYLPATECTDNLKAWTRDATQMIEDMDSRWASSAPYSDSVRADNIDPMTSRLDYILATLCD